MFKHIVLIVYLFFCLCAYSADSPVAKNIGTYGDWAAFYWNMEEGKVCGIFTYPKKEEGKYTRRGKVVSQVTMKVSKQSSGVVNFQAGYPIKKGSKLDIIIDGKPIAEFNILKDQMAWAEDEEIDDLLIKGMKRGTTLIVKGISSRGTNTTDTYSLRGFTASYKAISKICK